MGWFFKKFLAQVCLFNLNGSTLFTTYLGGLITFPLFLELNYCADLKIEEELTRGGEAAIMRAMITNQNWRSKSPWHSDWVVVKQFFSKPSVTTLQADRKSRSKISARSCHHLCFTR